MNAVLNQGSYCGPALFIGAQFCCVVAGVGEKMESRSIMALRLIVLLQNTALSKPARPADDFAGAALTCLACE